MNAGHPFPLKGRYYAMLFIHFEPTGHPLTHNESGYFLRHHDTRKDTKNVDVDREYQENTKKGFGGQSAGGGSLPPYIQRESPEEFNWRQTHPQGWSPVRRYDRICLEIVSFVYSKVSSLTCARLLVRLCR